MNARFLTPYYKPTIELAMTITEAEALLRAYYGRFLDVSPELQELLTALRAAGVR